MNANDFAGLKSALAAGIPAGPLGTVRLPMLRSTGAAVMHSAEGGDDCSELRCWGGPRSSSVEHLTVLEALAADYQASYPRLVVCERCRGEDLDEVEDYQMRVLLLFGHLFRDVYPHLTSVTEDVDAGHHRATVSSRRKDAVWRQLGKLRTKVLPQLSPPGQQPRLLILAASLTDATLIAWHHGQVTNLTAQVEALTARLVAWRDHADQFRLRGDQGRDTAPGRSTRGVPYLLAPLNTGGEWHWTPAAVARYVNVADPVGWFTLDGSPVPVVVAPYDPAVAAVPEATYLGPVAELLDDDLSTKLAVTTRLLEGAAGKREMDLSVAFETACAIVADPAVLATAY